MPGLVNLIGLQDALCDEIQEILKNVVTVNAYGKEVHGFSVYAQQLPKVKSPQEEGRPGRRVSPEDPDRQFFPYALVVCDSREIDQHDDPWGVNMQILLAIHDDNRDNQGHRKLIPMMECIADRFLKRPLLGNYWTARPDIRQTLQTSDFWPYFFGVTEITFNMYKVNREDPFYDGCIIQEVNTVGAGPFAGPSSSCEI